MWFLWSGLPAFTTDELSLLEYVTSNKFGLTKHDRTSGKTYQYRLSFKSYMNQSVSIYYHAINVHF